MHHIHPLYNPEGKAKELLDAVRQTMGSTPNMFTALANAPAALEAYLNFNSALVNGALDAKLREKIAVAVAGFNGCDYCASAHTFLGGKAGIEQDELKANLQGQSFNKKAQAALDFAGKLMAARGHANSKDIQAVREAGFSDEEIIEILAHVALNTFTNYFNETALTEIDFPKISTDGIRKVA